MFVPVPCPNCGTTCDVEVSLYAGGTGTYSKQIECPFGCSLSPSQRLHMATCAAEWVTQKNPNGPTERAELDRICNLDWE